MFMLIVQIHIYICKIFKIILQIFNRLNFFSNKHISVLVKYSSVKQGKGGILDNYYDNW